MSYPHPKLWIKHVPLTKEVEIVDARCVLFETCISDIKTGNFKFTECKASNHL